ncbi:unnamed protein product [Schistosoma margrebowiei]|uniref:Uncharacterized protein n=1 Tax=Schistosoma margrebowiei TaxID=48269 RepID=A0A3P7WKZ7_9TREM|nr:unnamed protein product [Schistosoma margrebowiei]
MRLRPAASSTQTQVRRQNSVDRTPLALVRTRARAQAQARAWARSLAPPRPQAQH